MDDKNKRLKNKNHERFCQEYVKNERNGAKAYSIVYGKKKEDVAKVNASRLLTYANVKGRIEGLLEEIKNNNDIEVSEIIAGYRKIKNVGLKEYKMKLKNGKTITVLVDSKNSKGALDSLARIKGLFSDTLKVEHTFEDWLKEEISKK